MNGSVYRPNGWLGRVDVEGFEISSGLTFVKVKFLFN